MAKKASTPKDNWKNRRVMAWLCLAAGLTYPLLMLFTLNEALVGIATPFYLFVTGGVASYIGWATADHKWQNDK